VDHNSKCAYGTCFHVLPIAITMHCVEILLTFVAVGARNGVATLCFLSTALNLLKCIRVEHLRGVFVSIRVKELDLQQTHKHNHVRV
jgi:hypothetical protein